MTSPRNEHLFSTATHFFKIILATHGRLKLPKAFTRKYGDGISNPVFLKSPDGTEWEIHWNKHDGEICLQKGWKEFATFYSLDHGHLLLFEYKGTSHFDVHIFDNSALEIDYPSHNGKDNITVEYVEIFDDQKTRVKSTLSSPQPCKKMKTSITTNVERSTNGVNLHQRVQTRSTSSQKAKLDEDEIKMVQLTSTSLNKATAVRSEHPSFKLVMKPPYINGYYLDIPPQFSKQYLKKTHAVVLLRVLDGRSWPVIYSAPRINGGWQKFALENNLNVGDVCVFELIQEIHSIAFTVSIFPGAEKPSCPISQVKAKTEFNENAKIDHSKCRIVRPSTNWTGGSSSQRSSLLQSHTKPKILTTRARKKASEFTSENPFFTVTLTNQKRLKTPRCPYVPSEFVRKYFVKMKQNVMMIQFKKKVWPLKFAFHSCAVSGMLAGGWSSFATENELQHGDVCIFELVNREDTILDLHVFRNHCKVMH